MITSVWMKLAVALICSTICLSNFLYFGKARSIDEKPLHDRMTDKEIRHFFGVETRSSVPEYEVTHPFESNSNGHFVSYSLNGRRKRSVTKADDHNNDTRYYKMGAFGDQLHLELKRNTKFIAPGLQLEKREKNGRITKPQVSRDSYFRGKLMSDPGSLVALSVNDGLTGMIRGSRGTYSVHPLPNHLAQHFRIARDATPHVVYKKPRQQDIKWESNTDFISVTERDAESAYREREGSINDEGQTPQKYLEAAILADEQVADFHGNKTEEFLLLIASIADEIFQGATIGEIKINYVVTRLVVITDRELGIESANSTLSSAGLLYKLASWARRNNKPSDSDPEQFDVASLVLSRGKGGLAALGGMCYQHKRTGARKMDVVNLNGDNGFQTAYTIVHEIGHNLGLVHDGKNCPDGVNIMARVLADGPGSLEWSPCSREKLQAFLRNPHKTCLDDAPSPLRPRLPDSFHTELPGQIVDGDEQCRAQYASQKFKQCQQRKSNCGSLYCSPDGYTCFSHYLRPLDGTSCGLRKWCIKGFCVDDGSNIPPKIDGGWSQWSDFKPCRPSCEGGVRYRQRTCTNPAPNNGGQDCVGSSTKSWEICNAEVKCDSSEPSFRDLQCTDKDSQSWPHYPKGANPCHLACRRSNSYRFYGKVISGTRCYRDKTVYDVCIEGQCQAVGCDKVLGSGKMKDRCGICGGNGDRCRFVNSSYTKDYRNYHKPDTIVHLPPNSSNVLFKERASSWNLIGIQDDNGGFLIRIPSWTNKVVYKAGTKIAYFNWYHFPDRLEIEGPTTMALNVMFVYLRRKPNVGIDYQYFRPLLSNETAIVPTCHWISSSWSECSEAGKQTRQVRCVRSDDQSPASDDCCEKATKPTSIKPCHKVSQWHVSDWLTCSKTCGKGIESRSVTCRTKFNKTHFEVIADSFCNTTTKPISVVLCNEVKCPAHWKSSPWSACSTVCLPGKRTRDVKCIRTNELGEEERVADIRCEYEPKPPSNESCNNENPCKKLDIGCFKTPEGTFSSEIGDFRQEADPDLAIAKCGELAHYHGFEVFALGKRGLCLSGPEAKHRYHEYGTVPKNRCPRGIGKGSNSFVYSFDPLPAYEPLGCFIDKKSPLRALPDHYASFRSYIVWSDIETTSIRRCASVARDKGYEYFAVQFYGECYSSKAAAENYNKYGRETNSIRCPTSYANVGGPLTNFVYRFSQVLQ